MNLNLFIYDFLCNFLPGSLIVYSVFLKFNISLDSVKQIGLLKEDTIELIIFLLISYLLGNYLNLFTRNICKISYIKNCINDDNDIYLKYEIYKNTIRVKNNNLIETIEIFEAKYLFFRNLALAFLILIILLNYFNFLNIFINILLVLGIIICLLKFKKYWNLSGKILRNIYDELN